MNLIVISSVCMCVTVRDAPASATSLSGGDRAVWRATDQHIEMGMVRGRVQLKRTSRNRGLKSHAGV